MNSRQYVSFYRDDIQDMLNKETLMALLIQERLPALLNKIAMGRVKNSDKDLDVNVKVLYSPEAFIVGERKLNVSCAQLTYDGAVRPYSYHYVMVSPMSNEITDFIHSYFRSLPNSYTEEWIFENGDRCWVFENLPYHQRMIDVYANHRREQIALIK